MNQNSAHLAFLPKIRAEELATVITFLPAAVENGTKLRILDIGAGTGLQAAHLSNIGFSVFAVDLLDSAYANARVFPVADYDGSHLPFEDDSFDIVFSSHVLEHVRDLRPFLREAQRVLRKDGTMIHLVPTASSRCWSMPAHYLWLARRAYEAARGSLGKAKSNVQHAPRMPRGVKAWRATLSPQRHGERGSALTEFLYYRRTWWVNQFYASGLLPVRIEPSGIFSTMTNSLAGRLSLGARKRLASVMGNSAWIYVLRPQKQADCHVR